MDINFLPNKNKSHKKEKDLEKNKDLEWSKPVKDMDKSKEKKDELKKQKVGGLKKIVKKNLSRLRSKTNKGAAFIDEEKLKKTRKEVLRLINEEEKEKKAITEKDLSKQVRVKKATKMKNILLRLRNMFDKNKNKKILVDYQKVLEKEKERNKKMSVANENRSLAKDFSKDISIPKKEEKVFSSVLQSRKDDKDDKEIKAKVQAAKETPASSAKADDKIKIEEKIRDKELVSSSSKKEPAEEIKGKEKEEWKTPQVLETNLMIKGEMVVFFNWRKNITILLISVVLSGLILGGIYGSLYWWGKTGEKESQYLTEKFNELNKEIEKIGEDLDEVLAFKKNLTLVNSLLDQHIYWTNFFKFLEENTLADVYYLDFSGDIKGKFNLLANTKNFSTIEAQIKKMLDNKNVIRVDVNQARITPKSLRSKKETGDIGFELKLSVNPDIFIK